APSDVKSDVVFGSRIDAVDGSPPALACDGIGCSRGGNTRTPLPQPLQLLFRPWRRGQGGFQRCHRTLRKSGFEPSAQNPWSPSTICTLVKSAIASIFFRPFLDCPEYGVKPSATLPPGFITR